MKKSLMIALAVCLVFSGCASGAGGKNKLPATVVSSMTMIEREDDEQDTYAPETPDSQSEAPLPVPETPQSSSSSSKAASSSSSKAASSSGAASSSSKAASSSSSKAQEKPDTAKIDSEAPNDEIRAVWISYLEFPWLLKNKTEAQLRSNMDKVCKALEKNGLNTIYFHVRPFGDAIYESSYFPWSHQLSGKEGVAPAYDPLEVIIDVVRDYGMRFEAWVNPYRIRTATSTVKLSDDNPATAFIEDESDAVIQYKGLISYNPASEEAQDLIVDGVVELVRYYDIDGIHFDDYFYPTTDTAFDKASYDDYRDGGGKLSRADWRRSNVDALVQKVYKAVKATDKNVQFGISPQANMDNNYNSMYIDVKKWVATTGYVDYICPQVYFGFENQSLPYSDTVKTWNSMIKERSIDLIVGLAPYKLGAEDSWAGTGKKEWLSTTNILARMVADARERSRYAGFALYRYDSLFNPSSAVQAQVAKEIASLKSILDLD